MAARDVKLIGITRSPFVNRAQFALNLKSVDYEFLPEINYPAKTDLLLKSNPVYKKIPVLIHADKSVCESLVILQYIDETWPENGPAILPNDPHHRATSRFWAAYIDDKWWPPLHRLLAYAKQDSIRAGILEKIHEGLTLLEGVFVKCSNGKDFFGGDDLGYVDIALGCFLGWMKASEIDSGEKVLDGAKTPALAKWADKFVSHKAVKGTLPEPQQLLGILKLMQANQAEAAAAEAEAAR